MLKIRGERPALDEATFHEFLRAQDNAFTTLRQLCSHTPMRKHFGHIMGNEAHHWARRTPETASNTADDLWRDQIPGLFSPLPFDSLPSKTAEGEAQQGNQISLSASLTQLLAASAPVTREQVSTDRVGSNVVRRSSDFPPENAPIHHSDDALSGSDTSSTNDWCWPSDTSFTSGASSCRSVPTRTPTPDPTTPPPVPSTPASTPLSPHCASFDPVLSDNEAPPITLDNLECRVSRDDGDDYATSDPEGHQIRGLDDRVVSTARGRSSPSCETTNSGMEGTSLEDIGDTESEEDCQNNLSLHDTDGNQLPAAGTNHDSHAPILSSESRTSEKRKGSPANVPRKSKVVKVTNRGDLPHLQDVPSYMKHPHTFLEEIRNQSKLDQGIAVLIQRSLYGFGHPKWFCLLKHACNVLRGQHGQRFPTSDRSLTQSCRLVANVRDNDLIGRVLRRYGLADIVSYRNTTRTSRRASPSTLKRMLRDACPELQTANEDSVEFQDGLKILTQDLKDGRNWYALAQKFGPGILAVVPAQPDFGISNTGIEKMPEHACKILIDALEGHRGQSLRTMSQALSKMPDLLLRRDFGLRYKFESDEGVESYDLDSQSLLDSVVEHSV
ncbi:hypothetical protein LTR49_006865 [Elasticomyces elasticus]|nr:hypothetical protein LTR49_006865 [Elasticomyces elasticus]